MSAAYVDRQLQRYERRLLQVRSEQAELTQPERGRGRDHRRKQRQWWKWESLARRIVRHRDAFIGTRGGR